MKKIYNKRKICEEIISTGEYQNKASKGSEDIWVIAYLEKYFKEDKKSIFQFWKKLYQSKYGDTDEYFAQKQFDQFYKKSKTVKFDDDAFNIYTEDIERVQGLDLLKWEKEFAFSFLVWSDLYKQYNFWEIPYRKILKLCDYFPRMAFNPNPIIEKLLTVGILQEVTEKCFDPKDGSWDNVTYYRVCATQNKKNITGCIVSFQDVKSFFSNFDSIGICSICGKKYIFNTKTKRDCCLECWTLKRQFSEHKRYLSRREK